MRVTRIEVFGFKSFMDRLVLPLETGITGVVGPNGCGKSNVVDALRWVLGETKASSLRGDILEDIIFNGTENLRPLGLAEVSITLRSAGPDFFADLVDPNVELDSQASDLLNQLDEASTKVVEFSKIDDAEEEAEKAAATEEQSAERPKLKVIRGNLGESKKQQNISYLSRFSWLRSCNEVQVTRRLYRSGESEFFINRVPCRLKDMKDLFRALGLGARAYTIVAQGEVSRIVSAKPEDRRLIIEEAAGVIGFRDKIQTARRRLEDTAVNISRLDDLITEVSRQVSILKKQAQRAKERQNVRDTIGSLDRIIFSDEIIELQESRETLEENFSGVKQREATAEALLSSIQSSEHEARSALMSVDIETDAVRSKIDAIREELHNRAEQRSHGQSKINELKAYAVAVNTERERIDNTFSTLEKRREECQSEIDRLSEEEKILSVKLSEHERFINSSVLNDIALKIETLRGNLKDSEKDLRALRDEVALKKGALDEVNQQILASSPVAKFEMPENLQVVADMLEVDNRYARAVQAVLSDKAEFLVSDDPYKVARFFAEKKQELDSDDKKGMGLGVVRSKDHQAVINRSTFKEPQDMQPILDSVTLKGEGSYVLQEILRSVYVSKDLSSALYFFESYDPQSPLTVVTLEGDIVTKDSYSSFRHKTGLIDLKAKASSISESCQNLEIRINEASERANVISAEITLREKEQSQVLDEIQERQKELREVSNLQAGILGRLESAKRVSNQISEDIKNNEDQKQALAVRLENYNAEEQQLLAELQSLVSENDLRIKDELELLKKEHTRLDEIRREGHARLSDAANKLDESRETLDKARAEVSELSLSLQKVSLEETNVKGRVVDHYGQDYLVNLMEALSSFVRPDAAAKAEAAEEVTRLKSKLVREGEVDFTSIERYEEENQRLENLNQQKADLKMAASTLERTIDLLTETSKTRFINTYEAIRRNFSSLVPKLFGGGKADLELVDPNNPLDTGVEIIVRPPGKKLRSIDLLSGGEKALAATALIFSMFLERPSPLCVLDEVDAPLDDANLVRLISLIKEMSKKTQFIMITHNKQSMVASDNLIGVTMQEPGASKVISVSLQEAFSNVA
jgi:chromosome segregation protein